MDEQSTRETQDLHKVNGYLRSSGWLVIQSRLFVHLLSVAVGYK